MSVHIASCIEAPAENVWRVLGTEFARIDVWSSFVKGSRPIDMAEVPDGLTVAKTAPVPGRRTRTRTTLTEVLVEYSDGDRRFVFVGVGLPPFIESARNTTKATPVSDTETAVTFDVDLGLKRGFELVRPALERRIARQFQQVQADLKRYIESGDTHTGS